MPLKVARVPRVRLREPQVVVAPPDSRGVIINPAFAELFARLGLNSATSFLELPGEVVSGHPDRHVLRVELPGAQHAFYLKRQHVVGWREQLRNRLAGFGWSARCQREAEMLKQLASCELPVPRWACFGTHESRAFLLVEEVPDAIDLRRALSDNTLSLPQRRLLATRIGESIAVIHAAGFSTPDLSAKHILVNPHTHTVTFLDWQSATRTTNVSEKDRVNALAALHASLAEPLASPSERARAVRAYVASGNTTRAECEDYNLHLPAILRASSRFAKRRSIRDQLQLPDASAQRLVWVAGEAVCAIPEVAAVWPKPALAPPFYGTWPDGVSRLRFAGRDAILIRGHTSDLFGRFSAWVRETPWRSPGVTLGRVLFHLERYGIPAPRLLAFGQRFASAMASDWFALHEAPVGVPMKEWLTAASETDRRAVFNDLALCLRKLHDAGCRLIGDPLVAFVVNEGRVSLGDPRQVKLVRRVSDSARQHDLRLMTRLLGVG